MVHYIVTHGLGPKKIKNDTMKIFVIHYMSIVLVPFFFFDAIKFCSSSNGKWIHSITYKRQILEEIGLISWLSLWLHKEEKDETNQGLKT